LFVIIAASVLGACSSPKSEPANNGGQIQAETSSPFPAELDTIYEVWPLDTDTVRSSHEIVSASDPLLLQLKRYSLNDSAITWVNELNKPDIFILKYHNHQAELNLQTKDTTLFFSFTKAFFQDSLGPEEEFYRRANLFDFTYDTIRDDALFFTVTFAVPETDWMVAGPLSVFYQGENLGQISVGSFKDIGY
jgi:hypothetical protein